MLRTPNITLPFFLFYLREASRKIATRLWHLRHTGSSKQNTAQILEMLHNRDHRVEDPGRRSCDDRPGHLAI